MGLGSRFMMQRYNLVEKAKESKVIGLIMGTLSAKTSNATVDMLKRIIRAKNKKPYQLLIGKINEAKLRNFADHVSNITTDRLLRSYKLQRN